MEEFPFQKVYDYFAQPLVLASPVPKDLAPSLCIVTANGKEITRVTQLPEEQIALFFRNSAGKIALGNFLRMALSAAKEMDEPICLVLIAESYFKQATIEGSKEETLKRLKKRSLADDPDASECIMITIYRPDTMRMGILLLQEDRTVTYSPLMPTDGEIVGSMTLNPDVESAKKAATAH